VKLSPSYSRSDTVSTVISEKDIMLKISSYVLSKVAALPFTELVRLHNQ